MLAQTWANFTQPLANFFCFGTCVKLSTTVQVSGPLLIMFIVIKDSMCQQYSPSQGIVTQTIISFSSPGNKMCLPNPDFYVGTASQTVGQTECRRC